MDIKKQELTNLIINSWSRIVNDPRAYDYINDLVDTIHPNYYQFLISFFKNNKVRINSTSLPFGIYNHSTKSGTSLVINILISEYKNIQSGLEAIMHAINKLPNCDKKLTSEMKLVNKDGRLFTLEETFISEFASLENYLYDEVCKDAETIIDKEFTKGTYKTLIEGTNLIKECPRSVYTKNITSNYYWRYEVDQELLEKRNKILKTLKKMKYFNLITNYSVSNTYKNLKSKYAPLIDSLEANHSLYFIHCHKDYEIKTNIDYTESFFANMMANIIQGKEDELKYIKTLMPLSFDAFMQFKSLVEGYYLGNNDIEYL